MDLEQYLEKDIITFLDGKIEKKDNILVDREEEYGIYMARDYLKELSYALDNEELTKAKRLFDDLKQKFSTLPKHGPERKKVYSLLERMYDKIQNYVKIKEGKIEVIKQGDSEVFKDTTEKFTEIGSKMAMDKIKIPPEFAQEFENEKHADLPIRLGKDSKLKDDQKTPDTKDVSVESKILDKNVQKYDKEHEDKDKEKAKDDISEQNVFFKRKSDVKRLPKDEWHKELIAGIGSTLESEMIHVTERLLDELNKKLEEKDVESIREEITKNVIAELDKKLDAQKQIFADEKEKMRKDILDQVYLKAKHIIADEDNGLNDTRDDRDEDDKAVYINKNFNKDEDDNLVYVMPANKISEDNQVEIYEGYTNTIKSPNRSESRHRHESSDENMRRMYEEAIYTMFQNDYNKAAKIFERILRIRPENKAAKIRLYECIEAIGNA